VYEIFLQLRGEADRRQVSQVDYALALNEGGSDAVVVSHIFGR
jgi:hypothetical protein